VNETGVPYHYELQPLQLVQAQGAGAGLRYGFCPPRGPPARRTLALNCEGGLAILDEQECCRTSDKVGARPTDDLSSALPVPAGASDLKRWGSAGQGTEATGAGQVVKHLVPGRREGSLKPVLKIRIEHGHRSDLPWSGDIERAACQPLVEKPQAPSERTGWRPTHDLGDLSIGHLLEEYCEHAEIDAFPLEGKSELTSQVASWAVTRRQHQPGGYRTGVMALRQCGQSWGKRRSQGVALNDGCISRRNAWLRQRTACEVAHVRPRPFPRTGSPC
jgi:hypothetical protein